MTTIPKISKEAAEQILRDNDRGGYCVPTKGLYPFQWMWDSGFTMLGWRTFDEKRAWVELQAILKGQWEDGMIPHIIFHQLDDGYFPGPDAWGTRHTPPTSGITDPPVLATMARQVLNKAQDRELALTKVRDIFPKLYRYHAWLHQYRDPDGSGLINILHPWEAGEDNSPAWDAAMSNVQIRPDLMPIQRRDTQHVDASQRPRQDEYQKYMTLVQNFRDVNYDPARAVSTAAFRVALPGFNSITLRADRDLLSLAQEIGADPGKLPDWIAKGEVALEKFWNPEVGAYRGIDLMTGEMVDVTTCNSFYPVFSGPLPAGRAEQMAAMLREWSQKVEFLVPSTDPAHPRFEARRYWRGPVWAVVNWMIAEGFEEHGIGDVSDRIRGDTLKMMDAGGFMEYFNPVNGKGLGGGHFTWTAAIYLALTQP